MYLIVLFFGNWGKLFELPCIWILPYKYALFNAADADMRQTADFAMDPGLLPA